MDHRAFLGTLSAPTLEALSTRRDGPGLMHLASHLGALALGAMWIWLGWPGWPVMLILHGVVLCFLFTLEHEATHKTPFATAWINEAAGHLSGALLLNPFIWFRYFHFAHHRHTNIPGKDPELTSGTKPETWRAYIWHVSGLPYWSAMAAQVIRNARGDVNPAYIPDRVRPRVIREARWLLVLYGLALASLLVTPLLLWIWLLPALLGQPFLRLYLLAEHGRCAFVANMFENTRTTYTNRIVRFLAWNMPYHVEHHALPQVPFHQLPALNTLMAGQHHVTAPSYRAFTSDYAAHLRPSVNQVTPPEDQRRE